MSTRIYSITLLLIFLATIVFAGDGTIVRSQDPVPGLYIVVFRSNLASPAQRQLTDDLTRGNGVVAQHVYSTVLKGFAFRGNEAAARAMSRNPNVLYVAESTKMYPVGSGEQVPPP